MSSLARGAWLGIARLRSGRSLVAIVVALLVVVIGALIERRLSSLVAADRTLVGLVFGVVVPLLAWGTLAHATGGRRLEDSVRELARHGADRRMATLGVVGVSVAAVASIAMLLAVLAVVATRFPADPRLGSDVLASAWIALLAGAVYGSWFALGSTLGRSGGGRGWALVLDWLFGTSASLVALPWPRGHVRNLLGSDPVLGMPQWSATAALLVLGAAYGLVSLFRAPR